MGKGLSKEARDNIWIATDRIALSWEPTFSWRAGEMLESDKRELMVVIEGVKEKSLRQKATVDWPGAGPDIVQALVNAGDLWRKVFTPLLLGIISDNDKQWAAAYGIRFDVANLQSQKWFEEYTMQFAQPIMATHEEWLSTMMQQATREGWSIDTMKNRMELLFRQWIDGDLEPEAFDWVANRMPNHRREIIARTESMRAANTGGFRLLQEWGAKSIEWVTTIDGRERPTHHNADGQQVKTGEPFTVGGSKMMHPHDSSLGAPIEEIAQCRCTIVPVIP